MALVSASENLSRVKEWRSFAHVCPAAWMSSEFLIGVRKELGSPMMLSRWNSFLEKKHEHELNTYHCERLQRHPFNVTVPLQRGIVSPVTGQNGNGQNGTNKMVCTKE